MKGNWFFNDHGQLIKLHLLLMHINIWIEKVRTFVNALALYTLLGFFPGREHRAVLLLQYAILYPVLTSKLWKVKWRLFSQNGFNLAANEVWLDILVSPCWGRIPLNVYVNFVAAE